MGVLTIQQIDQLTPMVARFSYPELDNLLRRATGRLEIDYIAVDQTLPIARAKNALDRASSQGYAEALLRQMIGLTDCSTELRTLVLQIFPKLRYVVTSFDEVVRTAIAFIDLRSPLLSANAKGKAAAMMLAAELPLLAGAKSFHGVLHRMQAADSPEQPTATAAVDATDFFDVLTMYIRVIDRGIATAQATLQTYPTLATSNVPNVWIGMFVKYAESLHQAAQDQDVKLARKTLNAIESQVDPLLSQLAYAMSDRASSLPFKDLLEALAVAQDTAAVDAVDAVARSLSESIAEHDNWQEMDEYIVGLDVALRGPPREAFETFEAEWKIMTERMRILMMPFGESSNRKALSQMEAVEVGLDGLRPYFAQPQTQYSDTIVYDLLRGAFLSLRKTWRNCFLGIDASLRSQLVEIDGQFSPRLAQIGGTP